MIDSEDIRLKSLRWLKMAFVVQAVILLACIVLIAYAFALLLPRLHRQQVEDQQTIQSQKDQLENTKDQLVRRYLDSAAFFFNANQGNPDTAQLNNALTALDAALKIDPNSTEALGYKATVLAKRGDEDGLKEALSTLTQSIQIKPTYIAYEQSGIIHCRLGEDQNAIQSFQSEFQIDTARMSTLSQSSEFVKYCSKNVKNWLDKIQH